MNRKTVEPTPFGPVVLFWAELVGVPKVFRVLLGRPGEDARAAARARGSTISPGRSGPSSAART
jgi:hypothetical protein